MWPPDGAGSEFIRISYPGCWLSKTNDQSHRSPALVLLITLALGWRRILSSAIPAEGKSHAHILSWDESLTCVPDHASTALLDRTSSDCVLACWCCPLFPSWPLTLGRPRLRVASQSSPLREGLIQPLTLYNLYIIKTPQFWSLVLPFTF